MPSIKAIFGADATGFEKAVAKMAVMSNQSAMKITAAAIAASEAQEAAIARGIEKRKIKLAGLAEYQERMARKAAGAEQYAAAQTQKFKDGLAAQRGGQLIETGGAGGFQQGRGFRRSAGSYAQLLHVGRASLDSLASGQDPIRVFMQQAPQAIQALSNMVSWATLAKTGLVAIGAVSWHFLTKGISESIYGIRKLNAEADRLIAKGKQLKQALADMREDIQGDRANDADALANQEKLLDLAEQRAQAERDAARAAALAKDAASQKLGNRSTAHYINQDFDKKDRAALQDHLEKLKQRQTDISAGLYIPANVKKMQAELYGLEADDTKGGTIAGKQKIVSLKNDIQTAMTEAGQQIGIGIAKTQQAISEKDASINGPYNPALDSTKSPSAARTRGGGYSDHLTANQQIGAFIQGPQISLLNIATQQLTTLRNIEKKVGGGTGHLAGMSTRRN